MKETTVNTHLPEDLPPLGTSGRTKSAVDDLAETYFAAALELAPDMATFHGFPGHEAEYPDYGPEGRAARADLDARTLAQLDSVTPVDDIDRVTLHALRERLQLSADLHAAGLDHATVANIACPVQGIREIFDLMPTDTEEQWGHIAARMRNVPAAVDSYVAGLRDAVNAGRPPSAPAVEEAATQSEEYAGKKGSFATLAASDAAPAGLREELAEASEMARDAYARLAATLRDEFALSARPSDAAGEQDYRLHLRSFLGKDLDPAEVYRWGIKELQRLDAEQRELAQQIEPGADIHRAMDVLNADPARQLHSTDELQQWMQRLSDNAVTSLADTHFEITDQMRTLECRIAPTTDGTIYYTPPSADFSRPGRMWWSVPEATTSHGTWEETTTVYHEGVPGHHLQCATAVANSGDLNQWRRLGIWISGHGEGWALYAERLMSELGFLEDPGDRMGMLDGERLRTVRVIFDVGFHCGYEIPAELGDLLGGARAGEVWTPEDGWEFLRHNVVMDPAVLRFEWKRYMSWPGQAPSYKIGQQLWLDARAAAKEREGEDFDLKRFHSRALRLGSVGLDTLEYALGL